MSWVIELCLVTVLALHCHRPAAQIAAFRSCADKSPSSRVLNKLQLLSSMTMLSCCFNLLKAVAHNIRVCCWSEQLLSDPNMSYPLCLSFKSRTSIRNGLAFYRSSVFLVISPYLMSLRVLMLSLGLLCYFQSLKFNSQLLCSLLKSFVFILSCVSRVHLIEMLAPTCF